MQLADWERPYLTMQPEYEAAQLGLFFAMFRSGQVGGIIPNMARIARAGTLMQAY